MSQIQRFSRKNLAPGGADVEVLLGCNTWEHTWMMDWGIRGKRDYVEGWWAAVDWAVVEESAKFDAYKRPDVKERLRHNLLGARARERGMPPP